MEQRNVTDMPKSYRQQVAEQAKKEIMQERNSKAVAKLKALMAQQADAKKVLKNIEREIEECLETIDEDYEDCEA